jgi:Na+-translocating ferredoxin:NAD+ oxidoreductase RnfG subunit
MRNIPFLVALPAIVVGAPAFAAEYLTAPAAQRAMFASATAFVPANVTLTDAQRDEIKHLSGQRQRTPMQAVWRAEQNGALLGWFIVDEVVGKHEFITYAAAISPDGHLLAVDVLVYRETYGFQVRDASWRAQFVGKTLGDAFKLDADVTNVAGATLSCRNISNGLKRLLALHKVALHAG